MKNMEKEPKIEKSLEEQLREGGHKIEKAQLLEDESMQCDGCIENDSFQFYQEGWFIEGQFYCPNHKEGAIKLLEEIDKDVERRKSEQEQIIKERMRRSGLE
ncbi:MAG: hypothetical protein Q8O87_03815 [bacterium]|nr:hypothetical protein [bacterium]